MKKFWNFTAKGNGCGELSIYGEISDVTWWGDEVTPKIFKQELDALGDINALDVFINSPGGDVFAAQTIYNTIKRAKAYVTSYIEGLAASSASVIAMAADKIIMPKNGTIMVHNASTQAYGNKETLLALTAELTRIDGQIAQIYADRCKKSVDECAAMMAAETWMSGEEAFKAGFCDEVEENKQIAACASASAFFAHYKHPPEITENQAPDGAFLVPKNAAFSFTHAKNDTTGRLTTADNGGSGQPVADTKIALEAQKRRFALNDKRKSLMEV